MYNELNAEFHDDKKRFFEKYFILPSDNLPRSISRGSLNFGKQCYVSFRESEEYRCIGNRTIFSDKEIPVLEMHPDESDVDNPVSIYWLPYEFRGISSIQLGNDASFFMTTRLSGCHMVKNRENPPTVQHVANNFERHFSAVKEGYCMQGTGENEGQPAGREEASPASGEIIKRNTYRSASRAMRSADRNYFACENGYTRERKFGRNSHPDEVMFYGFSSGKNNRWQFYTAGFVEKLEKKLVRYYTNHKVW